MDIILISGALLSLFLAVFLLVKKKNRQYPDKILAFWLFFFSIDFIRSYLLFFSGKIFLMGFGYTLPLLYAPLLFIYVVSLSKGYKRLSYKFLWHFVPFILTNVYMFFYIYTKPYDWRADFFNNTTFGSRPFIFNLILVATSLVYPIYILVIYRILKKFRQSITKSFSCRDQIDLFWVNYLLISVTVLWVISLYSKFASGYFHNLKYSDATMAVYFFELIIIMIIGYFGFKQGIIFLNVQENPVTSKYKTTGLSSEKAKELLPELLNYMEKNKPYLDPKLTISQLSEKTGIPAHHISQIINEHLDKNFFEFVNSYRIDEVKRKISQNLNKQYTLLAIAFDSGFNSKSSFNSIFKKYMGITPKEYAKQVVTS